MAVKLNHTIVLARDRDASAKFFVEIFGLAPAKPFGPFLDIEVANEVTLAVIKSHTDDIQPQHFAFLVSEAEFDEILGRVKARGLAYWADHMHRQRGEINRNDGGRGVYFDAPDGHYLEIITRPYGSGG
jgi:catechol 2,3-dioxygenase-like lactoylglutathione lyase family enzyme